jgi:hypothetical protein
MVEFDMPTNVMPGFFMYEIGQLKNPSYSHQLSGFLIQILDDSDTVTFQSDISRVSVAISPN